MVQTNIAGYVLTVTQVIRATSSRTPLKIQLTKMANVSEIKGL
jgi:hypothetical protein